MRTSLLMYEERGIWNLYFLFGRKRGSKQWLSAEFKFREVGRVVLRNDYRGIAFEISHYFINSTLTKYRERTIKF